LLDKSSRVALVKATDGCIVTPVGRSRLKLGAERHERQHRQAADSLDTP
jgi:hypothetical protein